ncbi:hypothetical protein H257_08938 [Aphanomyces astaci]|uniref:Uncharacterized protein n=1 Tax=Aphanomyces astaci TaxID=112090 RepID=W4GBG6_APHAT|nr:hypothetical protein H257_08938 [Aphanomyces astaci]ETV77022.1 hypothetical protein H257_08938 [Aphanomyces astaci]|eukprot:XP_009833328.1 hypothetical protein H257_08938 [Aphanomyces astaci]
MARQPTGRELSYANKMEVIRHLNHLSTMGKLARGAIASTASQLNIHRTTVSRILKAYQRNALVPSLKVDSVDRPLIYTPDLVTSTLRELPQSLRSTMRDMSEGTGIPLASLQRALKAGKIQRCSTHFKPLLSKDNKEEYIAFCRSREKIRKKYLTEGKEPEQCVWSSKRFIPKVMFLGAIVCLRQQDWHVANRVEPICCAQLPQPPAGTIVLTLVNVYTVVYRDYVLTRVIPVIKVKFPTVNKRVVLQHDNATPHGGITDADFACICAMTRYLLKEMSQVIWKSVILKSRQ